MRNSTPSSSASADRQERLPAPSADSSRQIWLVASFSLGLLVYLGLFLSTPLPSLQGLTRWEAAELRLLLPDEQIVATWFGDRDGISIVDRLPIVAVAGGTLVFAWLLGECVLALMRLDERFFRLERVVIALGIGLNAISLYVLAAGLAGWLHYRSAFFVPGAIVALASGWRLWRTRRVRSSMEGEGSTDEALYVEGSNDWLSPRWLWLAAPFLMAIMLGGMLPPVEFDVREYHLQAPKEFYQRGRIEFLPHNVYANMALGSEMFSLLAMTLLGDWWLGALAGKTVVAAFAPLTALALLAAGRRFFNPTVGYVAALVYISTPWIAHVSTSGLVEGASAFYWLMAVYLVMLWRLPREGGAAIDSSAGRADGVGLQFGLLLLTGWMAGAAVSCKYPAALFVVAPLAVWIAWTAGRRHWQAPGIFLLAVCAACGLWFAKNWALTGNPVYPLVYEWFGGATRTAAKNAQWTRAHYPHDFYLGRLANDLALVIWESEWLSPIMLPLAALSLFASRYRRTVLALGALLIYIVAAWWLLTHRIDRFWVPALPILALLAGLGAGCAAGTVWRRLVLASLVTGMAFSLLFVVAPHPGLYTAYFASLDDLRRHPSRVDPWHLYLNEEVVPPGWHVLAVGDAQMFDLEPPVLYNTVFDDSILEEICRDRTPEQIHAELLKRRISHVYVHWGEIARYLQPGNYGFPASINPQLFQRLVNAGVLLPPVHGKRFPNDHPGEIYEVERMAGGDASAANSADDNNAPH